MIATAIVTGAGGFIGRALVDALAAAGEGVLAIHRTRPAPDHLSRCGSILVADLREPGILDREIDRQTTVYHLAGSASVEKSVANPGKSFEDDLVASLNVLETVRRRGARLVFASTGSVYDPAAEMPLNEARSATRPASPYGAAKLAAEAYCAAYHTSYGLDTRVARIFSAFGPGLKRLAIYDFYERLCANPAELVVLGSGTQTRDLLYVDDVVRALRLISREGSSGEVYNVGSGVARTVLEVARAVAEAMGHAECRIVPDNSHRAGELQRMEADITKLQALGFSADPDFPRQLQATISSYRRCREPASA